MSIRLKKEEEKEKKKNKRDHVHKGLISIGYWIRERKGIVSLYVEEYRMPSLFHDPSRCRLVIIKKKNIPTGEECNSPLETIKICFLEGDTRIQFYSRN